MPLFLALGVVAVVVALVPRSSHAGGRDGAGRIVGTGAAVGLGPVVGALIALTVGTTLFGR